MKYGDISLVLCISTRLRLVTILSLLVKYLVIFHADPCNKSYIYTVCPEKSMAPSWGESRGLDPLPIHYTREGSGDLRALFVYKWNLKSRAKLTTYESINPLFHLWPVPNRASCVMMIQGTVKESHQWRRLFSEGSVAALIQLRSNTLVLVIWLRTVLCLFKVF